MVSTKRTSQLHIIEATDTKLVAQVKALADKNAARLGFFPSGAFDEFAGEKQILAAVDEHNELYGYLLYNVKRTDNVAYIVHLCTEERHRSRSIARSLFETLRERLRPVCRGIRVHCRRDFEAHSVWPQLGFVAIGEKQGRAIRGTTLTVFWFDFGHPTLFTSVEHAEHPSRLQVAIDASVFFDLLEKPSAKNLESHSLLADWLEDMIELRPLPELWNEINRQRDDSKRKRSRRFAETFPKTVRSDSAFESAKSKIADHFASPRSRKTESDLCQVSDAAAADLTFFVTRDIPLLDKSEAIYESVGVQIMNPAGLIIRLDELLRESEYQPARLAGSLVQVRRVQGSEVRNLVRTFQAPTRETIREFLRMLSRALSDPHAATVEIIEKDGRPLALVALQSTGEGQIECSIARTRPDPLAATLAMHIAHRVISASVTENKLASIVRDPHAPEDVHRALRQTGFVLKGGAWMKVNLSEVTTAVDMAQRLLTLAKQFTDAKELLYDLARDFDAVSCDMEQSQLLRLEHSIWPAKVTDLNIPVFVVPIQPQWALHLFDTDIAERSLFGALPHLILNMDNVYYRSARQRVITAPSRVLWYVSGGSQQVSGTRCVRACSYIDEVWVDKPKLLFAKFRRLGVYEWRDINRIAKGDLEAPIMAFKFSRTETLKHPIELARLRTIWMDKLGKNFFPLCPVRIPQNLFERLYRLGIGATDAR